jgi:hypothetical protein
VHQSDFPQHHGAVTPTHTVLNGLDGRVTAVEGLYVKKDGTVAMTAAFNAGGFKITNVLTPAAGTDAVTKTYADLKVLNPFTTRGDLITAGAAAAVQRLALGTNNQALMSNGTDAVWGDPTAGVSAASAGTAGKIALATTAETQAGADNTKAVTPADVKGALLFSKGFQSADQTGWAINSVVSVAHGLGVIPMFWHVTFKCITGELGYSTGDEVFIDMMNISNNRGAMYGADATNVFCMIQNAALNLTNKGTAVAGTLTPANWSIKFRAWA